MLVYQRVKWFKSRSSMAGATAPFEPRRSIQCRYFQRIFLGKSAAFSRKMIQHQGSNRQTDTPLVIQKTIENGPCIEIVDLHWFTELKNGGSFHIVFWCFLCVYQRVTFFCQKKTQDDSPQICREAATWCTDIARLKYYTWSGIS